METIHVRNTNVSQCRFDILQIILYIKEPTDIKIMEVLHSTQTYIHGLKEAFASIIRLWVILITINVLHGVAFLGIKFGRFECGAQTPLRTFLQIRAINNQRFECNN